jgi:hypothetical protein
MINKNEAVLLVVRTLQHNPFRLFTGFILLQEKWSVAICHKLSYFFGQPIQNPSFLYQGSAKQFLK